MFNLPGNNLVFPRNNLAPQACTKKFSYSDHGFDPPNLTLKTWVENRKKTGRTTWGFALVMSFRDRKAILSIIGIFFKTETLKI